MELGELSEPLEGLFKRQIFTMAKLSPFEEFLLGAVPEEKRHLLDHKVEDYQLAEIAKNLTYWQEVVPYLGLKEAEETAIKEDNDTAERRRIVPCIFGYSVSLKQPCLLTHQF